MSARYKVRWEYEVMSSSCTPEAYTVSLQSGSTAPRCWSSKGGCWHWFPGLRSLRRAICSLGQQRSTSRRASGIRAFPCAMVALAAWQEHSLRRLFSGHKRQYPILEIIQGGRHSPRRRPILLWFKAMLQKSNQTAWIGEGVGTCFCCTPGFPLTISLSVKVRPSEDLSYPTTVDYFTQRVPFPCPSVPGWVSYIPYILLATALRHLLSISSAARHFYHRGNNSQNHHIRWPSKSIQNSWWPVNGLPLFSS